MIVFNFQRSAKQFYYKMRQTRNNLVKLIFLPFVIQCISAEGDESRPVWRWSCEEGNCVKKENNLRFTEPALNLQSCKMFCKDYGLLWPQPTGFVDLGSHLAKINFNTITMASIKSGASNDLMEAAFDLFKKTVKLAIPDGVVPKNTAKTLIVNLVNENPDTRGLTLTMSNSSTDESYMLRVSPARDQVNATITAKTFFGIRHGLQTLSQLIVYDDIRDHLLIMRDVVIDDKPVYPYRGILLDTARNYYTVDSIKRTLDAMAEVKLNTFHWHITDSQSFPFVSERRPELTKHGAYSPSKVYTKETIRDIVQYALVRGIRVLPEFDAPAHVGEGWQNTNLTVCFKAEPWLKYCVEPPCGQLNPTKEELYDVLEDIYLDMEDVFKPDMFHMGGDEVSERCWNSSSEIQEYMIEKYGDLTKGSFLQLWDYFQKKAQSRVYKAFGKKLPLILWTSTLTEYDNIQKYLDKDEYIIQVWTTGVDPQIKGLLDKGYKLIMSNYDALYFDCGFSAWVGSGNNWCSPYIGWQKVYDNSPAVIARDRSDQILGGEAALWSEQSDTATIDGRLWPRAAAFAERMWAEPKQGWMKAEHRMLHIRERLVKMGVQADSIEPEWCYQNEGYCHR